MIGYTPAEQAIRAAHGEPPDTGADNPPAWHDQPDITAVEPTWTGNMYTFEGASDVGLPGGAVYGPAPDAAVLPEWWRP